MQVTQRPATRTDRPSPTVRHTLFVAAWMAVALGVGVQATALAARILAGATPKAVLVLIDFIGGVSWAAIVCAGIALGTAAARHSAGTMGMLGVLFAPLAWAGAKGAQRGTQWMLGEPLDTLGPLVYQIGAVKAVEYALLGYLLGRLIRSPSSTLRRHALLGLAVGAVAGSLILGLNLMHADGHTLPLPKVVGTIVNELIFPAGCSVVIYFIARLSDRDTAMERIVAGGG